LKDADFYSLVMEKNKKSFQTIHIRKTKKNFFFALRTVNAVSKSGLAN